MKNIKHKILGFFLCVTAIAWTYFGTLFFAENRLDSLLSLDIIVYLPFFVSIFLIFVSSYQYIICKHRKGCEETRSFRIGFFASSIALATMLFIIEETFRLERFYVLFDAEYIIESFLIFNPLLVFYFLYQVMLYFFFDTGIVQEIEDEIIEN